MEGSYIPIKNEFKTQKNNKLRWLPSDINFKLGVLLLTVVVAKNVHIFVGSLSEDILRSMSYEKFRRNCVHSLFINFGGFSDCIVVRMLSDNLL